MLLWALSFSLAFLGVRILVSGSGNPIAAFQGARRETAELGQVNRLLHEVQETLEAGLIPAPEKWEAFTKLPAPWGTLSRRSLEELRSRGAPLLPTLKRFRALAEAHTAALGDARAKSAQAMAQAMVCGGLVPAFGAALYFLMPGISEHAWVWLLLCGLGELCAAIGCYWLVAMASAARWAGLTTAERPWALAFQCAGERFLALVRGGTPPDLAWPEAADLIRKDTPVLATGWGHTVWTDPTPVAASSAGAAILASATALRRAVQASLMEGRPCAERAEAILAGLRQELKARTERELTLLPTRALKPLFIFVAPALFVLLGCALFLAWTGAMA